MTVTCEQGSNYWFDRDDIATALMAVRALRLRHDSKALRSLSGKLADYLKPGLLPEGVEEL